MVKDRTDKLAVMAVTLPTEADRSRGDFGDPGVCDGDAVGIAAEIGEHLAGPPKGG